MAKTIYIPENKISLLKEYFTRGEIDALGENFFVFFRDKFFIFNSNSDVLKNAEELIHLLNDAGLDDYAYNLENFLELNGPERFSNYAYVSLKDVPRVLCGTINGSDLHLSNNIFYDVLNSPEFKKLASSNNFSNIYVGSESGTRDKLVFSNDSSEKTLGDKYIPNALYHGTILRNAIGIVTKGLRPSPERSNFTDKGIYHADTVFLSKDVTTACAYSSMFSHSFITDINLLPVVIEYDVNKMDKSRITLDFDLYASHGNGKDKPYEKVLKGVDEINPIRAQRIRLFNRKSETVDVLKDGPLKFNRVGYRGVVMPNAIKKIYVFTSRDNAQMFIPEWEFASVNDFLNSMDDIKEFCLNNIDLDESKKVLPPYEKDEFEIGDEGGNNEYFHIDENIELELNADEVSLKSFKKNDTLALKLWDGFKLNPRARLRLLDIADDFWDTTDVSWVKPSGIILTGSICNFNWSKYSDIDLHLVVNFSEVDERKDFVQEYFDAKKNEWNNSHKGLKIYGYPVEVYVEDIDAETESGGIYDLEENKWIKKPSKDEIKPIGLNKYDIKNLVAKYCTKIDNLCDQADATDDKHILGEIGKRANKLLNRIKKMRKFGLERSGEGDLFNIAYKCYRRMGYLDKLFDIKSELYDRIKSISESKVIRGSSDDIFEIAKERFGVTYDIRECGYILPDGSMLDFTGSYQVTGDTSHLKGRRSVDHREISDLNYGVDGKTKTGLNISMAKFIKMGAIRVHASSTWGTINLYVRPTQQQIDVLLRLIQYAKGCVAVEIGDGDESLSYGEYEEAKPRKVVADILRYFDEGINLEGDVNESKKTVVISDGQLELIKEYLDKDYNMPLYKYFKWADNANDDKKAESLAWTNAHYLIDYLVNLIEVGKIDNEKDIELITNAPDDYYDEDEYIEQFIEIIKKYKLSSHFISWCYDKINYMENPAWMYMDFIRSVKNEWCIHFGSDSDNIAREGFTGGTYGLDYLAYTNAGEDKPYEGYDFAFLIDDRNVDFNNYGNEAVIFQTSGVLCYHYGDEQNQVIFWGPYAKNFIPIKYDEYEGEWVVKGMKDQILKSGKPSEIAEWATENLPQYRKQIMAGKNGYIPKYYDYKQNKLVPYKKYRNDESIHQIKSILNENVSSYIKLLKEEVNARGNASHDIYRKRWNQEREMLKRFLKNNGIIMTSKENGKTYYVYYDTMLSNLIGINYCVCIQYDMLTGELGHQIYVRAIDKFSQKIFSPRNDTRGRDNKSTLDDSGNYSNFS